MGFWSGVSPGVGRSGRDCAQFGPLLRCPSRCWQSHPFAIIGIIFASIYVRSGHLSAAIYAHFLFNLIGYVGTVIEEGVDEPHHR